MYRSVLKAAAGIARDGAFDVEAPLMTLGIRPTTRRPSTATSSRLRRRRRPSTASRPTRSRASRRSRTTSVPAQLYAQLGVAWNAGIFLWQRRAIRDAIERYTGLMTMIGTVAGSETGLQAAYDRLKPLSIDRAVMEGAASDRRVAHGGDGRRLERPRVVDPARRRGRRRRARAAWSPPNEAAQAEEGDLVVERQGGALAVSAGPRDILAPSPVALLAGAAANREPVEAP